MATIFVFGSNILGIHGAGAAKTAHQQYGAVYGVGIGRTGDAYAIPTKLYPTYQKRQMPLTDIKVYVEVFINYAKANLQDTFLVTRIGCGLAGYTDKEIAPMFIGAPANCLLPDKWIESLKQKE